MKCEVCLEVREDADKCFYKLPDCGPGGNDIDGFCCVDCNKDFSNKKWAFDRRKNE